MRESSGVARERVCVATAPGPHIRQACFVKRGSYRTAYFGRTRCRRQTVTEYTRFTAYGVTYSAGGEARSHGRTRTTFLMDVQHHAGVTDLKLDEPTVVVACATCSVSRGSAVPSAVLTHLRQAWEYMDGHRKT